MISASLSASNLACNSMVSVPGQILQVNQLLPCPAKAARRHQIYRVVHVGHRSEGATEKRGEHVHVDEQHLRALAFGGRQLALRTRRCQEPRAALRQRRRVIDCRIDLARRPTPLVTPLFWRVLRTAAAAHNAE